jgi:hypothetical protein
MRVCVGLVALTTLALATTAAAGREQPYPLLVKEGGVRVFGPASPGQWGRCPNGVLPLRPSDRGAAARAGVLLVRELTAGGWYREVDTRGASAHAARLRSAVWTRWGLAKSTCGAAIVPRTFAVAVGFPRVNWSASLSSSTFFASRIREGWIFWHQAH